MPILEQTVSFTLSPALFNLIISNFIKNVNPDSSNILPDSSLPDFYSGIDGGFGLVKS